MVYEKLWVIVCEIEHAKGMGYLREEKEEDEVEIKITSCLVMMMAFMFHNNVQCLI